MVAFWAGEMTFYKSTLKNIKNEYNVTFCWRLNYLLSKESNPYNILRRHEKKTKYVNAY